MRARCQPGQGSIPIPIPTPIQTMVWWIGNHCLNSIDERERICGLHQTTNLLGALGVLAVPLVRGPWQLLNTAPMELRPPRSLRASSPSGSEDLFGGAPPGKLIPTCLAGCTLQADIGPALRRVAISLTGIASVNP